MKKFTIVLVALLAAVLLNQAKAETQSELEALCDSISELELTFNYTGTEPGYYDADAVAAFEEALEAAQELAWADEVTEEECTTAAATLREALAAAQTTIPLPSGYYWIKSEAEFTTEVMTDSVTGVVAVTKAMYDDKNGGLRWTTWSTTNLYQMWKFEQLEDGYYSVQNVGTGWYIKGSTATNTQMPLSEEFETEQILIGLGDGTFAFCSELVMESTTVTGWSYHTGNHDQGSGVTGDVMIWQSTYTTDARNTWSFEEMSEEFVDSAVAAANTPQALLASLVDSIDQAGLEFEIGTDFGNYTQEAYDAYEEAYEAAANAADGLTDEEYNALAEALRSALAALYASKIDYEGYFYIVSAAVWTSDNGSDKGMYECVQEDAGTGDYGEGYVSWNTLDEGNSYYIWYIEPLGDGSYSIQNAATGNYLYGKAARNTHVETTETLEARQYISLLSGGYCFFWGEYNYDAGDGNGCWGYHTGNHDSGSSTGGQVQVWQPITNATANARNIWWFRVIDDEKLLNSILIAQATATLTELLDEALTYAELETLGIPGYMTEEGNAALNAAIDEVSAAYDALGDDATLEEITALLEQVQAAVDAAIEDISPKTDTWYYIVSASSIAKYAGRYMYAADEVDEDGDLNRGYVKFGGTDSDGNVKDETLINTRYMWRVVEVEDGEYALQNYAMGIGTYDNNSGTTASAIAMTDMEDGIVNITYVGDASFTIWYSMAYTYYLRPNTSDNFVVSYYFEMSTSSEVDRSPAYWQFIPVEVEADGEQFVSLPVQNNNMTIQCRPFSIENFGDGTTVSQYNNDLDAEISFYAVKSIVYDEDNDETVVELTLKDEFEAGEPFVMVVGDPDAYDGYSIIDASDTIDMLFPVPTTYVSEPGTANGLVGTFNDGYVYDTGLGYFSHDDYELVNEITTGTTYITFNCGYITAAGYEEQEGDADLTIYFESGEITGIKSATAIVAEAEAAETGGIYDLQGRQVAAPGKGIYIVNGKKVIYK